jgi:hypothetical protein
MQSHANIQHTEKKKEVVDGRRTSEEGEKAHHLPSEYKKSRGKMKKRENLL